MSDYIKAYQMKHNVSILLIVLLFSSSVLSIETFEKENNKPLLKSCQVFISDSKHNDAIACIYYIQGLLAGAWDVNKVVGSDTKKPIKKDTSLSWSQRAYRYRVGTRSERGKDLGHIYYCSLDKNINETVIEELIKNPLPRVNSVKGIHNWVFDALKKVCPDHIQNQ